MLATDGKGVNTSKGYSNAAGSVVSKAGSLLSLKNTAVKLAGAASSSANIPTSAKASAVKIPTPGQLVSLKNESVKLAGAASTPSAAKTVFGSNVSPSVSAAIRDATAAAPSSTTLSLKIAGSAKSGSSSGGSSSVSSPVAAVQTLDYLNADLAKHYNMDAATAYQEALSNTAYQRAVKDLQAAGLNPVLAAGQVSGADSFAGVAAEPVKSSSGGYSGSRKKSSSTLSAKNVLSAASKIVSGIGTALHKPALKGIGYALSGAATLFKK